MSMSKLRRLISKGEHTFGDVCQSAVDHRLSDPSWSLKEEASSWASSGSVTEGEIQAALAKVLNTSNAHQRWLASDLLQHLLHACESLQFGLGAALPKMVRRIIEDVPAAADSAPLHQAKAELTVQQILEDLLAAQILRIVQLPVHWQAADRGQQVPAWRLQTLASVCKDATRGSNVYKDDMKKAKTLVVPLCDRLRSQNDRHRKLAADFLDHLLRECPERMAPLAPYLPELCRAALQAQAHDKSEADHTEACKLMKSIWDRYECGSRPAAPPLPQHARRSVPRTRSMSHGAPSSGDGAARPHSSTAPQGSFSHHSSFSQRGGGEGGPAAPQRQRSQRSAHSDTGAEAPADAAPPGAPHNVLAGHQAHAELGSHVPAPAWQPQQQPPAGVHAPAHPYAPPPMHAHPPAWHAAAPFGHAPAPEPIFSPAMAHLQPHAAAHGAAAVVAAGVDPEHHSNSASACTGIHQGLSNATMASASQSVPVQDRVTDPSTLLYELTAMAQQEPPIKIKGQYVLEGLSEQNPKRGGQALVWFARGADNTGHTYAIKWFYTAATMQKEMEMYSDPVLRTVLPPLVSADYNHHARHRTLQRAVLPPFLVLARHKPLYEWAQARARTYWEVCAMFEALAKLVHKLHSNGMVHRDLKPHNVVLITNSTSWSLIDPGCVARSGERMFPECSAMWAPPEVVRAARSNPQLPEHERRVYVHFSHDVFSLGMLGYEVLTGARACACPEAATRCAEGAQQYPWERPQAEWPQEWRSSPLRQVLEPCLNREAANRPNVQQVLANLRQLQMHRQ